MGAIQDLFKTFGDVYLERFGTAVPIGHARVIDAIRLCRTEDLGAVCYRCEECELSHVVPAACGNRHCPQCQHRKSMQWLERQLDRQLSGPHFMLTFTVPEALRRFLRDHQRPGYGALFEASSGAIKSLVANPRWIGGDQAGFFGVLHTWGRQLQYHPHIHYVVPGGALGSEDGCWHAARPGFFLPVRALSKVFRGKFKAAMETAGLLDQIPTEVWHQDWNVNCQAVPNAEASISYLAPYVFKVAIADHRIVKVEQGQVTFSYRKVGSHRTRTMTLDALEFIRRFLQHVLPTGFMKVRYYGFLSPTAKMPLDEVKARVELAYGFAVTPPDRPPAQPESFVCVCGGGALRFHRSLQPGWRNSIRGNSTAEPDATTVTATG
ncbi:MAG: transposase [Betaproteobacteria bacterium]|nr:transposase [Betaproteobacteria bacterium]